MNASSQISPNTVGERLRIARENAKHTQVTAADAMGMSRTTLIAIEQGQRRVRLEELQKLAKLYGTSLNALLRQEAVHLDLIPRFRKQAEHTSSEVEAAIALMNNLIRAEVELENLLGIQRIRNYPQERPILSGNVKAQAEQDALELRQWLGLGLAPIKDIVDLFELQIGIRTFVRRLDGKISGMFVYDDNIGACILLNANHPRERRTQTGAHELGHFISVRYKTEVLHDGTNENLREELYANAFARGFLTPERAVVIKFKEVTAGSARLTRRHIVVLAHFFGVSREAMTKRLEELGLTKSGTWEWFVENGGITEEHVRQVLGDTWIKDEGKADADQLVSLRLKLMIEEVWKQELLSEGQIARLLQLERVEVRHVLDSLNIDESDEADAAPTIIN